MLTMQSPFTATYLAFAKYSSSGDAHRILKSAQEDTVRRRSSRILECRRASMQTFHHSAEPDRDLWFRKGKVRPVFMSALLGLRELSFELRRGNPVHQYSTARLEPRPAAAVPNRSFIVEPRTIAFRQPGITDSPCFEVLEVTVLCVNRKSLLTESSKQSRC
ncbi:unnamed protein product [Nezara viridula]|uniref:Uncharacterized protein n=1 Tax=Nezara viridula TaxID=85310 RepID=A0A9P0HTH1_NEZVI|nr:unnamed protein product [Nezara viridula]